MRSTPRRPRQRIYMVHLRLTLSAVTRLLPTNPTPATIRRPRETRQLPQSLHPSRPRMQLMLPMPGMPWSRRALSLRRSKTSLIFPLLKSLPKIPLQLRTLHFLLLTHKAPRTSIIHRIRRWSSTLLNIVAVRLVSGGSGIAVISDLM